MQPIFKTQQAVGIINKHYSNSVIKAVIVAYAGDEMYEVRRPGRKSTFYVVSDKLRTFNIKKSSKAVDYQSDDLSASWIDKNGRILKTVVSGCIGLAHQIVSKSMLY